MTVATQRAVLRLLRDEGPQTRTQLATALGLPRTTMASTFTALEEAGLVEDGPLAPSTGGRRSAVLVLGAGLTVLVVSWGESRLRVAVLNGHLAVTAGISLDALDGDPTPLELATRAVHAAQDLLGDRAPSVVGVAHAEAGEAAATFVATITSAFPGLPVVVEQPVRAMVVGERHAGAAKGLDDVVAVRLGAGVTAAAVVDGRLNRGGQDHAGAIGHLRIDEFGPACTCGNTGCLDSFVGAVGLVARATEAAERGRSARLAQTLDEHGRLTLADVVAGVAAGDPAVVQLARDVGRRLGHVLAGVVAMTNPDKIVLGGPVAALGDHLLTEVRSSVYRSAPARASNQVAVELSELGERAVLVGTGHAAFDELLRGADAPTFVRKPS